MASYAAVLQGKAFGVQMPQISHQQPQPQIHQQHLPQIPQHYDSQFDMREFELFKQFMNYRTQVQTPQIIHYPQQPIMYAHQPVQGYYPNIQPPQHVAIPPTNPHYQQSDTSMMVSMTTSSTIEKPVPSQQKATLATPSTPSTPVSSPKKQQVNNDDDDIDKPVHCTHPGITRPVVLGSLLEYNSELEEIEYPSMYFQFKCNICSQEKQPVYVYVYIESLGENYHKNSIFISFKKYEFPQKNSFSVHQCVDGPSQESINKAIKMLGFDPSQRSNK